jgi:GAF domain-containing protein
MTTARGELLRVLGALSVEADELRFGQLMANLATLAQGARVEAIWEAEDEELLQAARRLLAQYLHRKETTADTSPSRDSGLGP